MVTDRHEQCTEMISEVSKEKSSNTTSYYVRCRYCDSSWSSDSNLSEKMKLPKDHWCGHEKIAFICPACGFTGNSYLFQGDS